MKRLGFGFMVMAALAASLLAPGPARAGSFAVMFDAGLRSMSNSPETQKAIFDKRRGTGAGLGLTYDHGSRWRFGVDVRRINREGERAYAADRTSEAFRLGHPLTLNLTESLVSASFRFGKVVGIAPYVTAGGGMMSWKESSNIAGLTEKADGSSGLFEARIGFERQQGPLRLAIEGGITWAPNTIGVGGISKVYEESDLGGLFVAARIGFSQKK